MEAKIVAMRAPEHLIDLGLKRNVGGVLRVLDHGIEYHESAAIFQHAEHLFHHPFGIAKVMQAKRNEGPIESVGFKRQSIRLTSAQIIRRNWICVLMADIEHGERLIDANDSSALKPLRHRPSHSAGTRRHVEYLFISLQHQHFSQFLGEIIADPRDSAVKLCRVLRIMEMSVVPVAMPVFVGVFMVMVVTMFVTVGMAMLVIVSGFMTVVMRMVMFMAVLLLVIMLVAVLVMLMFVSVIVLMFMFVFFAHGFAIPSNEIQFIFAHLHPDI